MLSRTADHLFWMSRYIERAENLARMLDVTYQTSLVPQSLEAAQSELECHHRPEQPRGGIRGHAIPTVNAENVLHFMVSDAGNHVIDPQLPARGARERPCRARHADHRNVGDA